MPSTLDYASAEPDAPRGTLIRARASWPLLLSCIYLPYAWLLVMAYPWNDHRVLWLKLWPILPGIMAGLAWGHTEVERFALMGWATVLALAVILLPFRRPRSPVVVIPVAAVVLTLSCLNSYVAYALFRM